MARSGRWFCCLVCTVFWVIIIAFIATVIGVAAFVGQIKSPKFDIKDLSMSKFDLDSNGSVFSPSVVFSMQLDLTVESYNPNRISLKFDRSFFNVTWQDMILGGFVIEAFTQPSQRTSVLTASFVVDNYDPLKLGYTFMKSFVKGSPISLKIDGGTNAALSLLKFYTPKYKAKIHCDYTFNSKSRDILNKECTKKGGL